MSVGESFYSSSGEVITNVQDKLLRISFPNKLFLTVEHPVETAARFSIEFWYKDQNIGDKNSEQIVGYSLIKEELGKLLDFFFLI